MFFTKNKQTKLINCIKKNYREIFEYLDNINKAAYH